MIPVLVFLLIYQMTTSWYDEPLDDLVCKYFLTMHVSRQSVSLKQEVCHTVIDV